MKTLWLTITGLCFGFSHRVGVGQSRSTVGKARIEGNLYSQICYIENTDCFGVMFYANYPQILERAALSIKGVEDGSMRLTSFKRLKLQRPFSLGDHVSVEMSTDRNGRTFSFREEDCIDNVGVGGEAKAIGVQIGMGQDFICKESMHVEDLFQLKGCSGKRHKLLIRVHWDERHPCVQFENQPPLSTKAIFKYFERARTHMIGGPRALAAYQKDQNVLFLVGRIADYTLEHTTCPYDEIICHSSATPVGDSMTEIFQVLASPGGLVLAQTRVTLVCASPADSLAGTKFPLQLKYALYNE